MNTAMNMSAQKTYDALCKATATLAAVRSDRKADYFKRREAFARVCAASAAYEAARRS